MKKAKELDHVPKCGYLYESFAEKETTMKKGLFVILLFLDACSFGIDKVLPKCQHDFNLIGEHYNLSEEYARLTLNSDSTFNVRYGNPSDSTSSGTWRKFNNQLDSINYLWEGGQSLTISGGGYKLNFTNGKNGRISVTDYLSSYIIGYYDVLYMDYLEYENIVVDTVDILGFQHSYFSNTQYRELFDSQSIPINMPCDSY